MSCEIRCFARLDAGKDGEELFTNEGDAVDQNRLQDCLVSVSPTGEVLVIARHDELLVFTLKWDSREQGDVKMKYRKTWHGHPSKESGDITSVLCLPLISLGQSASGVDWTCIVVGFSSGTLKFYTEMMYLLVSDVLHTESVIKIKCNSYRTPKQSGRSSEQLSNEIVYVLYKSVVCVLNGFSLFQTLRSCRSKLARQIACSRLESPPMDENLPMNLKKYSFVDQEAITDACFIGQTLANIFDHLVTTSVIDGFHGKYRSSPPQASLIISTGRKPFLGFHYTMGSANPVLAEVAVAFAGKLKEKAASVLPFRNWINAGDDGASQSGRSKASEEPPEQLYCRFGLCDLGRQGDSVITSPDFKFSAITDSFGRIFLVENTSGIARRLWKGYRKAQCGFVEVEEVLEKSKRKETKGASIKDVTVPKRSLFIVIYSPQKGLLEIFPVQRGPCIASYKVSKYGRLIYTPHGLMGYKSQPTKGTNASQYPVTFMSGNELKEIIIPFHYSLRNDGSCKAKDLHILEKMQLFLKEERGDDETAKETMSSFARDLKTEEIKMQVIEMLVSNRLITPSVFLVVLKAFAESLESEENAGSGSRSLAIHVDTLEKLIPFYAFVCDLNSRPPNYNTVVVSSEEESSSGRSWIPSDSEMSWIFNSIKKIKEIEIENERSIKVSFAEKDKDGNLAKFLSYFDIDSFATRSEKMEKEEEGGGGEGEGVYLGFKEHVKESDMNWMGEILFSGIFYSNEWINEWKTYVGESKLDPLTLVKCLLSYWLNKNLTDNLAYEMECFIELLKEICLLVDPSTVCGDYNEESHWWKTVRAYLKNTRCLIPCFLASVACRTVTITVEQMKEMMQAQSGKKGFHEVEDVSSSPSSSSHMNEWENVSQDTCEWDILIMKLEGVALLNAVLNPKNAPSRNEGSSYEFRDLSLNSILEKGDGYVSELVAKWLVHAADDLDPRIFVDSNDVEFQTKTISTSDKNGRSDLFKSETVSEVEEAKDIWEDRRVGSILDSVGLLKEKFPYSLTTSSLLSNICWQSMIRWCEDTYQFPRLVSAMSYLSGIQSPDVKVGLSYLCWTTYLAPKFEAAAKLINKLGKTPMNNLCTEVRINRVNFPEFFKLTTQLLSILLDTERERRETNFVCNEEVLWQNEPIGKTPSLVSVALSQPELNRGLVALHYELSMSLYMVSDLNIRFPKLFSCLFRKVELAAFFKGLENCQFSLSSDDSVVVAARKNFLYKVIAGAVQTIEVVESIPAFPVEEPRERVPKTRVNVKKSTEWIHNCFVLARMWEIPLDDLRRQQVCELYSNGFDRLAEEVLTAVNERGILASQLLVIAGKRLKIFLNNTRASWDLKPNLTKWLNSLDVENLKNHNVDLTDMNIIVSYILNCKLEKAEESELAIAMSESVAYLDA